MFTEWVDDESKYDTGLFTHVIRSFEVPKSWRRYRSFDFGYTKPFSVGWWAADPDGRLYRYREYYGCTGVPNQGLKMTPEELGNYDLILLLDCANRERIACGPAIGSAPLPELETPPMLNVDHHVGNNVGARWNLVIPDAAAASQIAAEIALGFPCRIQPRPATLWLLGILTDTGAFRFSNTLGRTLRVAAELLDCGADLEGVVNAAYYSKPLRQQRFEVELLETQERVALDGRYIYAYIPDELFRKYDFDMRDGEGLIELLREVAGTKIVALFYRKGDSFKVSLRSKDQRYPVGPLARALGGGGHDMAAGITLTGMNHEEVEALLLEKAAALLDQDAKQD